MALAAAAWWAYVSPEVDQRLTASREPHLKLDPKEWRSGDQPWIIEAIGDPRIVSELVKTLAERHFTGKTAKLRAAMPDGRMAVGRLAARPPAAEASTEAGRKHRKPKGSYSKIVPRCGSRKPPRPVALAYQALTSQTLQGQWHAKSNLHLASNRIPSARCCGNTARSSRRSRSFRASSTCWRWLARSTCCRSMTACCRHNRLPRSSACRS